MVKDARWNSWQHRGSEHFLWAPHETPKFPLKVYFKGHIDTRPVKELHPVEPTGRSFRSSSLP